MSFDDTLNTLMILKQPQCIFYKDDNGGKRNNIHVQFSSKHTIENEEIEIKLMVFNIVLKEWLPCSDQTILELQGTINTKIHSSIDVFFRISRVSYRNNNQPYALHINIGKNTSIKTDPFLVKSKSKSNRMKNNEDLCEELLLFPKKDKTQICTLLNNVILSMQKTNIILNTLLQYIITHSVYSSSQQNINNTGINDTEDTPPPDISPITTTQKPIVRNMSLEAFDFMNDDDNTPL